MLDTNKIFGRTGNPSGLVGEHTYTFKVKAAPGLPNMEQTMTTAVGMPIYAHIPFYMQIIPKEFLDSNRITQTQIGTLQSYYKYNWDYFCKAKLTIYKNERSVVLQPLLSRKENEDPVLIGFGITPIYMTDDNTLSYIDHSIQIRNVQKHEYFNNRYLHTPD